MSTSRQAYACALVIASASVFAQTEPEPQLEPTLDILPQLPFDVVLSTVSPDEQSLQNDYEEFAWKSFLALNQAISESDSGSRWQSWASVDTLLAAGDSEAPNPPPACRPLASTGLPIIHEIAKSPGLLSARPPRFPDAPLIDQNGEYVRYETRINPTMYEDIIARQLDRSTPETPAEPVNFACGDAATAETGAIMVQAAWKILTSRDDTQRFHTMEALVYTPGQEKPRREERCEQRRLGLVGLHIVRKTVTAPSWIWASFEHSDNAPVQGEHPEKPAYNFHNWQCRDCPVNQMPLEPWNPNRTDSPTQVVRLTPIAESTAARNASYHTRLRAIDEDSVWRYYDLIGVQWPQWQSAGCAVPYHAQAPLVIPSPAVLANTVLETYLQDPLGEPTSNCMGCHFEAIDANGNPTDFVYFLSRVGNRRE